MGREWANLVLMTEGNLERFLIAQSETYDGAVSELQAGHKCGHWMWYVFPQLRGLGRSETSIHYGIADLNEAKQYLAHPVLGPRLRSCAEIVSKHKGRRAKDIFGQTDAMKFRSCMTLFSLADGGTDNIFQDQLENFFGGVADPLTFKWTHRD